MPPTKKNSRALAPRGPLDDLRAHERPLLSGVDYVRRLVAEAKGPYKKAQ
jgi:hypothetical protein